MYKHIKLLLFCECIRCINFVAFYDQNNFKTKKQPQKLQTTIHGGKVRG